MVAARTGNLEILKMLKKYSIGYQCRDANVRKPCAHCDESPLRQNLSLMFHAVYGGSVPCVQYLLSEGVPAQVTNNHSQTPLIVAAKQGRAEMVKLFLANFTVDAAWTCSKGMTALAYATSGGHHACVDLLLQHATKDVVIDLRYGKKVPTVQFAMKSCRVHMWHYLQTSTALMVSSRKGFATIVQLLCTAGADVSMRDAKGRTALMHAAMHGHRTCIEVLLHEGASLNAVDAKVGSAPPPLTHTLC